MALTKTEKTTELERLAGALKGVDSAILLDYKGLNVPQVTELRRQVRAAKGQYRVVKNTLARRALKGTRFENAERVLPGHDGHRLHGDRPGGAGQDADHVRQDRAHADHQGGGGAGPAGPGRPR